MDDILHLYFWINNYTVDDFIPLSQINDIIQFYGNRFDAYTMIGAVEKAGHKWEKNKSQTEA